MNKLIAILCWFGAVLVMAGAMITLKINSGRDNPSTHKQAAVTQVENDYSAEQKAILKELRETKAYIEQSKKEINETLVSLKACAVQKGLDPNVSTAWWKSGYYGPTNNWTVVSTATGNPILWGFRSDGLITWKAD